MRGLMVCSNRAFLVRFVSDPPPPYIPSVPLSPLLLLLFHSKCANSCDLSMRDASVILAFAFEYIETFMWIIFGRPIAYAVACRYPS